MRRGQLPGLEIREIGQSLGDQRETDNLMTLL